MVSRTICLEATDPTRKRRRYPRPRVRRHRPDVDNLLEQVTTRTHQILEEESPPYLYVNPIVTITCDEPTEEFFSLIRKRQAEWCKRSRTIFSRKQTRSVKNFFTAEQERTKFEKFMSRGLQFTGLLFVNGTPVPQNQWPLATR